MQFRYAINRMIPYITLLLLSTSCGTNGGNSQSNPVPSISFLTPANAITGSLEFELSVNGSGFTQDSVIRWDGNNISTTFISNTRLKALISSNKIASNGTAQVSVYNPLPGGGLSGTVLFIIHNSDFIITSLNPTNRTAGESAFNLTVNGKDFNVSSIVRWNGSERPTSFVSSTQLTAEITGADINLGGTAEVSVFNPPPNNETSNALNFTINNAKPILSTLSPMSVTVGSGDFALTVHGSSFSPSSVVRWGGYDRATTFVSDTQLRALILSRDLVVPQKADISVFNPSPGGGISNKVLLTIDSNADNWIFLGNPNIQGIEYPGVEDIIVDRNDPDILYAAVDDTGLFTSRDGGFSWNPAIIGPPSFKHTLASDPNSVDRVFYAQNNNLYVSIDRGLTWTLLYVFDSGTHISFLKVSEMDTHVIYAGLSGSYEIFCSSPNDGLSWDEYSYGQTLDFNDFIPSTIAEDILDGTLYVGFKWGTNPQTYDAPFLKSVDGGMTWENLLDHIYASTGGQIILNSRRIVVNPNNQKIYALDDNSLITSTDQGTTWTHTLIPLVNRDLIRDPYVDGRFFMGTHANSQMPGGVHVSTDDGMLFFEFGLQGLAVQRLALTGDGKYLFAVSYDSGIYYSPLP